MANMKSFQAALGASVAAHLIILLIFSMDILPKQKILGEIEVNYFKVKSKSLSIQKKSQELSQKDYDKIIPGQKLVLSKENRIPQKSVPAFEINQNEMFLKQKNSFLKPSINKIDFLKEKAIKISNVSMESNAKLPQNPVYLTYSNFVHERIRHSLYNRFSHVDDRGVVYLKFALNADGSLMEYYVINTKSQASDRLKQITIDGLKDASPFPPFPKELGSPVATFNVTVHFIEQENK